MAGAFQLDAFQTDAFQTAAAVGGTLATQLAGSYGASVTGHVTVTAALTVQQVGAYQGTAAGTVAVAGSLAAQQVGTYEAAASGHVDVAGSLTTQQTGSYSAAITAAVAIAAALATQQQGAYQSAISGNVAVSGALSVQQQGAYDASLTSHVTVAGTLAAQQVGAYQPWILGNVKDGKLRARLTGDYGATLTGHVDIAGALSVQQIGAYVSGTSGQVRVFGHLAVQQQGAYGASLTGHVTVAGTLAAQQVGFYTASGAGSSLAYVPRDPALGLIYLVEIDGYKDGAVTTFRFGSVDFNTRPQDNPSNAHYQGRLKVPGDFSRSLFSSGATNGQAEIGYGTVELSNPDGALDDLDDYGFDGRKLRILSMEKRSPIYTKAQTVFEGTMAQAEITWSKVTFQLRDRLAELNRSVQTTLYAGTTTAGGMNEAEGGPDDLKGQPKPLAFGAPKNVTAVNSNAFDLIYDLGTNGLQSVAEVRDKGVLLTATGSNYTTVSALRTATIASGKYATALNLGLIRTGSKPVGQLTASPVQGATAAARTAAQAARAVLLRMGMVENTDFLASDVAALDALNNAVVGFWTGTSDISGLELASKLLNSIAASIAPDREGVYRMVQFALPSGNPDITIGKDDIIDGGQGIEKLATGDQGKGVPAWKVNVNYALNNTVMTASDLDTVNTTAVFRTFAEQQWRVAVAQDNNVLTAHPLATEITIDTCLQDEAAAQAMATFWLDLYSTPRKRFQVPVKSVLVERIDLGSEVRLQLDRFGMSAGKDFRVIGIDENYQTTVTTLDLWG